MRLWLGLICGPVVPAGDWVQGTFDLVPELRCLRCGSRQQLGRASIRTRTCSHVLFDHATQPRTRRPRSQQLNEVGRNY